MSSVLCTCALLFILGITTTWSLKERVSTDDIKRFLMNYDRNQQPSTSGPVNVKLGLYLNKVQFDRSKGTMGISTYIRMAWQDERFKALFPGTSPSPSVRQVVFNTKAIELSWKPDLFLRNAANLDRINSLEDEHLFRVNRSGDVWYVTRMMTQLHCPDLDNGSHKVTCPIQFESFAYNLEKLTLDWLDRPVDVDKNMVLRSYTLMDIIRFDCSENYTSGSFPCLEVRLVLHVDQLESTFTRGVYLVSSLLVFVSWLGFWMQPSEKRVFLGIGVTMTLSILFMAVAVWHEHSSVNRTTQCQIWILFCIAMVLGMVFEFALVFVVFGTIRARLGYICYKVEQSNEEMELKRSWCSDITDFVFGLVIFPLVFIIGLIAVTSLTFA